MRRIFVLTFATVLLVSLAAACGDDGEPPPTPEAQTTLSLAKSMRKTGDGEFRFTLELTNEGDNAAVNVTTSDVWEEGLEVMGVGVVDGKPANRIGDNGVEFILEEFGAGRMIQLVYTARCRQSGEWQNVAAASSDNAEAVEASVTAVCP